MMRSFYSNLCSGTYYIRATTLIPFGLLLASCHASAPGGQVVAVVDGHELTAAQLAQVIDASASGQSGVTADDKSQAVRTLINQTLLMDAALKLKLDSDPNVSRALDAARRSVLVQAYIDKISPATHPSEQDISTFYDQYPYLYAHRRSYQLTDLSVAATSGLDKYMASFSAPNATMDSLIAQLGADGIHAVPTTTNVDADALPLPLAQKMASLPIGSNILFQIGNVQHFARIDDARESPVTLEVASLGIAGQIQAQAKDQAVNAELERLRKAANIQMGTLGSQMLAGNPSSAPAPGGSPPQSTQESVKKGLSGL